MVCFSPGTQPGHPLNHHYPASAVLVAIDALMRQSGALFELVLCVSFKPMPGISA